MKERCGIMWKPFDYGKTISTKGSENGIIIKDEEYKEIARITLEKDEYTPYGITCGIYGMMCHTVFAGGHDEALGKYEAMKQEIGQFFDAGIGSDDEISDWAATFTSKW